MSAHLYYVSVSQLDFMLRRHDYKAALVEVRIGLGHTSSALKTMRTEHRRMPYQDESYEPPNIPFIGDTAGALAALVNDTAMFEKMDEINALPFLKEKADVQRYRRDAEIMEIVRIHLATVPQATLPELKSLVSDDEKARVLRLVNWLEKWGDVTKTKDGATTVVMTGKPVQKPSNAPPAFRITAELRSVPMLRFLQRPAFVAGSSYPAATLFPDNDPHEADTEIKEQPYAPALRHPLIMATHTTKDGSWLIGKSHRKPDGSYVTPISRFLPNGTRLDSHSLPHLTKYVFSDPERPEIVAIDDAANVWVYGFDGALLVGVALGKSPELRKIYADADVSGSTVRLRVVDVSKEHGLVAFAYEDRCWIFTLAGESVVSFRVPATPGDADIAIGDSALHLQSALVAQGLDAESSPRDIAHWLDSEEILETKTNPSAFVSVTANFPDDAPPSPADNDLFMDLGGVAELDTIVRHVSGLKIDWINYLTIAPNGETVWVSTYSGLLVQVAMTGIVVNSWILPCQISKLWTVDDHTFVVLHGTVAELYLDGDFEQVLRTHGSSMTISGAYIADRYGSRGLSITNLTSRETKAVRLARDFRAMYPTVKGVRVETTNTFADIEI